jgi:hypothetical protein
MEDVLPEAKAEWELDQMREKKRKLRELRRMERLCGGNSGDNNGDEIDDDDESEMEDGCSIGRKNTKIKPTNKKEKESRKVSNNENFERKYSGLLSLIILLNILVNGVMEINNQPQVDPQQPQQPVVFTQPNKFYYTINECHLVDILIRCFYMLPSHSLREPEQEIKQKQKEQKKERKEVEDGGGSSSSSSSSSSQPPSQQSQSSITLTPSNFFFKAKANCSICLCYALKKVSSNNIPINMVPVLSFIDQLRYASNKDVEQVYH